MESYAIMYYQKEDGSVQELYDSMLWGDYDGQIDKLAKRALEEEWTFPNGPKNGILKNYLEKTFLRLDDEGKVLRSEQDLVFNTGLFTEFYEPLYAHGIKGLGDKYKFKGFETDYELGACGIGELPERADYFEDPSLLVFNWKCRVNVQYQHVLEDNNVRLPDSVINSARPLDVLKGVVDTAIKRTMANYKLAVPQFYKDKIQLLIPLCFEASNDPGLALVLSKMDGDYYQGHTCLTMEMAYRNARLIAKPESNWLSI